MAFTVMALIGWAGARTHQVRQEGQPATMLMLVVSALGVHLWVNLLAYPTGYSNFQGRYLFPVIVPWAYLLAGGWTRLLGKREGPLYIALALLVLLDSWALVMYILPHYYG